MQDKSGKGTSAGCAIAVMAKASSPGCTKTRLVPPLSYDEAADLNTAFLRDVADNLLSAAVFADITGWMAYAPAGSEAFFKSTLSPIIGLIETAKPDFGACLFHAAATLLEAGHGAACLLNSDSPTLPIGYLVAAATALAVPGDRVVLGPSTDGGYYLIGIKRPHRGLFENVEWSTERVFRQTLGRCAALGLPVFELPAWYDVDNADALHVLIREVIDDRPFHTFGSRATAASATRRYLSSLLETSDLARRLGRVHPSSLVA
jgi:rSAM/selenodomain-associated transferase 1